MTDTTFKDGISVLIPVYNYDCSAYVRGLSEQLRALSAEEGGVEHEILVLDDASTDVVTLQANRSLNSVPGVRVFEGEKNIGRARARNFLLDRARHRFVLITDADAALISPRFLATYWQRRAEASVLVGGLTSAVPKQRGHELRFRYEQHAELQRRRRAAKSQKSEPGDAYHHFSTFNVWLDRRAVASPRFDERCEEYGYEDTLFGLTLREQGISARIIDNPLGHLGIDSNESFLAKTEASLRTLSRLTGIMQDTAGTSRLWQSLRRIGLSGLVAHFFRLSQPLLRRQLLSRHPSLWLFQLYKLGYYAVLMKSQRQDKKQN